MEALKNELTRIWTEKHGTSIMAPEGRHTDRSTG